MQYKIELRYFYGWDDAGWTDEIDGKETVMRFQSISDAQSALDVLFADVKAAVAAGGMEIEEVQSDYRIVAVNN